MREAHGALSLKDIDLNLKVFLYLLSPNSNPSEPPPLSMDSKHETSKLIEEEPATATRRYSVTKKFVPAARKLTVAEEVGKKLARMQNKKPKEFLEICFREFDQACSLQVSELRDTFDEALVQLSDDCDMMEKNLTSLLIWKQNTTKARVDQATAERNNERKEKLNLAKWMAMFTPQDKKNTKVRFALAVGHPPPSNTPYIPIHP